ncbi:MAG: hypothetical protein AAGA88_01390 [Pseudomonadota bacterium]
MNLGSVFRDCAILADDASDEMLDLGALLYAVVPEAQPGKEQPEGARPRRPISVSNAQL